MLVVVFGLPGSGKSTVAGRLARRLGATWLSSDAIRVEQGLQGDYSKEAIGAVYQEMMTRAREALTSGVTVVLDGSFSSRNFRARAAEMAESIGVPLALIRMVADEQTSLQRVGRRRKLTEAGPEAYRLLERNFDPVEGSYLTLDSSRAPLKETLREALRYCGAISATSSRVDRSTAG